MARDLSALALLALSSVQGLTAVPPARGVASRGHITGARSPASPALSAAAADTPLYCLNVKLCVKAERREEFLACIKANQRGTLGTEALAVTYLFGEDTSTANTFHFFEQYRGKDGFVAHTQTPHFAAWEEFAATKPFTSPPEVCFYYEDSTGRTGRASIEPGESLYALHVDLYVKPDRREEFLEAIRGDQEGALTSEDRCVAYLFGEDADEPNTFHMFEQYVDRAGFEQHAKSPHYGKWSEFKATEPFSASAKVAYYTTIESLDTNSDVQAKAAVVSSAGAPPAGFEWGGVF